ncbi:MAG TPA: cytochrome c [Opitutaceae bacterium]|nr:cytochrome c [Opitutaceae bacterium]
MRPSAWIRSGVGALAALALAGCGNMKKQPNPRPYADSSLFPDGTSARTPPAHTVQSGVLPAEATDASGRLRASLPVPVTLELLRRGREEFDAECSECHGPDGYGQGIVVRRGFPPPPSLHEERLRTAPDGHLYDVIVRGYGLMYPAGHRVSPQDRWAVVAYIRALQLSQHASLADVPAARRGELEGGR